MGFTQVSTSHQTSPMMKFVSRGDTTVVDARGGLFVGCEAVAVQEDDGHAAQTGLEGSLQLRAQVAFIEHLHHIA